MISIGWVVISKQTGKSVGRVYKSQNAAYAYWRGYRQTNEDVDRFYDVREAFI